MSKFSIGQTVSIDGTEYDGTIIDIHPGVSPVLYLVELHGCFDELPTDLCEWHKDASVIWPAYAEEMVALEMIDG